MIKRCLSDETKTEKSSRAPYEKDYQLEAAETTLLFDKYLEMGKNLEPSMRKIIKLYYVFDINVRY